MRKIFLSIIFLLILSACAFADAMLYMGTGTLGSVRTVDKDSEYFVSVDDAGRLLGFTSSRRGEELTLTKGNIQLRVILNSAAGWKGYSIIPLYSSPFEQDGKFWLDAQSAAALFQSSVGRGRLRFVKTSGNSNSMRAIAEDKSKSEIEFGKFNEEIKPPIASVQPAPVVPEPRSQSTVNIPPVKTQPTPAPAPAPEPVIQQVRQEDAPVIVSNARRSTGGNSQPRYETFKPNDKKTERGENYSGTIQGIRWTLSEGTHKKIRAVITTD
ncbi:MAG: hypothetical protein IJR43_09200, partial [Synergistaceae bacterium]|nr:hypothetical protein [Synergistaceae bacterium]